MRARPDAGHPRHLHLDPQVHLPRRADPVGDRPSRRTCAPAHQPARHRRRDFGPHYARTLRLWRERFDAAAGELAALGFDAMFRRMWDLYLAYSEAGFRPGLPRRVAVPARQLGRAASMTVAETVPPRPAAGEARRGRLLPAVAARYSAATLPVRLRAWDGSEAGPGRRPGARPAQPAGAAAAAVEPGRARPGPGVRHRRARRRGRPRPRPARRSGGPSRASAALPGRRGPAGPAQPAGAWRRPRPRPRSARHPRAAAAAPAVARPGSPAGCTAGSATGPRSRTTTTCPTTSTS